MACEFCSYIPKDLINLGEHQFICHGPDEEGEEEPMVCYICGWKLESKVDLMKHRREKHEKYVRLCQYFAEGCCDFTSEECWYKHELPSVQTIKKFKCGICEKVFDFKWDLMKHRQNKHTKTVSICTKNRTNSCHFGEEKCWFIHKNKQNDIP